MTLLQLLIAYGVTNNILVGDGVDSFRDFMPDSPNSCVVFHEYAGDPPSPYTSVVHRSVQVKVRAEAAEDARAKAVQLCSLFSTEAEDRRINFTASNWGQVYVRQTPFKLSQDECDRVIYCFNLGITTNILD